MIKQIEAVYWICDELSQAFNLKDDAQCHLSTAEVICFANLSASYYGGNYKLTRQLSQIYKFFPKSLSHSRIVRRIHRLSEEV